MIEREQRKLDQEFGAQLDRAATARAHTPVPVWRFERDTGKGPYNAPWGDVYADRDRATVERE